MQIKSTTTRFGLLTVMLLCITAIGTHAPLLLHFSNTIDEHHHCDSQDHHHSEPESDDTTMPQHDGSKCPVCQVLMGMSGKFICAEQVSIRLTTEIIGAVTWPASTCLKQHSYSPANPRGPPLA